MFGTEEPAKTKHCTTHLPLISQLIYLSYLTHLTWTSSSYIANALSNHKALTMQAVLLQFLQTSV